MVFEESILDAQGAWQKGQRVYKTAIMHGVSEQTI